MFYRPLKKRSTLRIDGETLSERRTSFDSQVNALYRDMNAATLRAKYNVDHMVGTRRESGIRNLAKLNQLHRVVVAMHLQGKKNVEIAEVLDKSAVWVSNVLTDPLVKELVDHCMAGVEGELEALFPMAVAAVRNGLSDENPLTALKAVDRFVGMSGRFAKKEGSTSAEDVIKKALELATESVRTVRASDAGKSLVIDAIPGPLALPMPSFEEGTTDDGDRSAANRS